MLQKICYFLLFKMRGWKVVGDLPTADKYLFVVVPHTSNWDFVVGWLAIMGLGLKVKIFVKDAFFVWPLNYVCKWFGVMPVNRSKRTNFVDSASALFESHEQLAALITPEGTRSFQPTLKSGYYYLSKKADVPIVLAGIDFNKKSFTLLPAREALATFEQDQAAVIEFAKSQHGKNPEFSYRYDDTA